VFQLAQVLGWTPAVLRQLTPRDWSTLVEAIEAFSSLERRRIFHLAYERRFVIQSLDAFALHPWTARPRPGPPRFQASFCLDDREESIRRHLEEVAPDAETFGLAGFYGVAMYLPRGGGRSLRPALPYHHPAPALGHRASGRGPGGDARAAGEGAAGPGDGLPPVPRRQPDLRPGAVLTAGLGVLATFPLVARILFPRLTARIRGLFGRFVQAPPATSLQLERADPTPGPDNGHVGYAVEEMTAVAERQLQDMGLTSGFARLVFFIGHGSFSLNNPHKSAYDCGRAAAPPARPTAAPSPRC